MGGVGSRWNTVNRTAAARIIAPSRINNFRRTDFLRLPRRCLPWLCSPIRPVTIRLLNPDCIPGNGENALRDAGMGDGRSEMGDRSAVVCRPSSVAPFLLSAFLISALILSVFLFLNFHFLLSCSHALASPLIAFLASPLGVALVSIDRSFARRVVVESPIQLRLGSAFPVPLHDLAAHSSRRS